MLIGPIVGADVGGRERMLAVNVQGVAPGRRAK
jgi:hypothetical protein